MNSFYSVDNSLPRYEEVGFAEPLPEYDSPPRYQVLPADNYVMGPSKTLANFRSGAPVSRREAKSRGDKNAKRLRNFMQRMLSAL